MSDNPDRLAERLRGEGLKTTQFFLDLNPGDWQRTVYTEGSRWTVSRVLAHFVASEVAFSRLIADILSGGEGAPEGFDIDEYNERRVTRLREYSIEELVHQFGEARLANVEAVSRLNREDLARQGRHPFLGIAPLEDMIKLIYRHNQIHQRDIRKVTGETNDLDG